MQRTLDCKKKASTSPNRRERPLIRKTGWGTTESRKRERHNGQKEREKGEDAVFYEKEDKSLIDVENVETTGEKCCHLSWLTNTYHWTVQCVRSSEAHFTYINYVYHSNVFEADNIYKKNSPQMIFHQYCLLFLFRSGAPPMTLLTAESLTDSQLPAR